MWQTHHLIEGFDVEDLFKQSLAREEGFGVDWDDDFTSDALLYDAAPQGGADRVLVAPGVVQATEDAFTAAASTEKPPSSPDGSPDRPPPRKMAKAEAHGRCPGDNGRQKAKRARKRQKAARIAAEQGNGPAPHERRPHASVLKHKGKTIQLSYDSAHKMHIAIGAFIGKPYYPERTTVWTASELGERKFEFFEWDGR